eukprot:Rhum_TRINITY_DN15155_c1_g7::Rhum_TRINITY_DN15155_c1_g7_i1::g.140779::m.140779
MSSALRASAHRRSLLHQGRCGAATAATQTHSFFSTSTASSSASLACLVAPPLLPSQARHSGCVAKAAEVDNDVYARGMHILQLIKDGEHEDAEEAAAAAEPFFCEAEDEFLSTPLLLAARGGHASLCEVLLSREAKVDPVNSFGSTPLVCAASNNHLGVARLLLDRGANVNHRTRLGSTPLIKAAAAGHKEMCALLLERGGDASFATKLGQTAATSATAAKTPFSLEALLETGNKGVEEDEGGKVRRS